MAKFAVTIYYVRFVGAVCGRVGVAVACFDSIGLSFGTTADEVHYVYGRDVLVCGAVCIKKATKNLVARFQNHFFTLIFV